MCRTASLLSLNAPLLLPSVSAWSLVWTDAKSLSFVEHGSSSKPCTPINNPKGKHFEWDSEQDPVSVFLYGNAHCTGTAAGWAEHLLDKNASVPILSYKVDTTDSSSSSSSLSGGAIAGIVIGVVVGVILIGAALYLVGWRRKLNTHTGAHAGCVPPPCKSPTNLGPGDSIFDPKASTLPYALRPASTSIRLGELQGDASVAELGDSARVNELEGRGRPAISR